MTIRQLVNAHETFVEIDDSDAELLGEYIMSGYDDWDGKTLVPQQQSELDFAKKLADMNLRIDSESYRDILKREDPLVPNAGVAQIFTNAAGIKEQKGEPDNLAVELERRRIRTPGL